MLFKKLTFLLVSLSLVFASTVWAAPVKILPLGDSITSDGGNSAYRNELYEKLNTAGYDFEFVGSLTDNDGTPIDGTKHEGRSGWRADSVNSSIQSWLSNYDVDITLIHLGTNDILQSQGTDTNTITDLTGIVTKLTTKNTNMKIFLAKILPLGRTYATDYTWNALLNKFVANIDAATDLTADYSSGLNSLIGTTIWDNAVTIVDQYTGFTVTHMKKSDMIHPNTAGEEKMAQKWFEALKTAAILPPILTLTPSATTTGGVTVTITPTTSSTGAISYSTNSVGICAVAPTTGEVTPQAAGACVIIATQEADATYAETDSAPLSIAVTASPQTITFAATTPETKTFGDDPFTVSAKSIVGLVVAIESTTESICTINNANNKVTLLKSGDCTLKATQAGGVVGTGANAVLYAPATPVTTSITIKKAEQTITIKVALPLIKTFGDAPFGISAESFNTKTPPVATGLPITTIGTTTANVCTYNATTKKIKIKSAGQCTIKVAQQGNDKYSAKTTTFDIAISAKGQTIDFPVISNKTINSAPFELTATASSGLKVSFSSTTTNVCEISNKTVTLIATGTCRITASAGNSNNTTASAIREFEVTKATQTITFASNTPTTKTEKDAPFQVSAVSDVATLSVTIQSTTENVCTIDANNKVSIHTVGSCILEAKQAGNATYAGASTQHTIVISTVSNTAYDDVVSIITSDSNVATTTEQLQSIGLKNINPDLDYTKGLKNHPYANKNKPTIKELQTAIDSVNKEKVKTAGAASPLWLTLFALMGIATFLRKKLRKRKYAMALINHK